MKNLKLNLNGLYGYSQSLLSRSPQPRDNRETSERRPSEERTLLAPLPQRFARYAAVLMMLLTLGVGQMWANNTSATFYLAIDAAKTRNNNNCSSAQFQIKYGSGDGEWSAWTSMEKHSKTYNGKVVYKATYKFPYDGYYNWQWRMEENGNQHWYKSSYAGSWSTSRHNGELYDYENGS